MNKRLIFPAIVLIMLVLTAAGRKEQKPLNLIIFIGDGMGTDQVYAGMTASGFTMTFPAFPVTGFSKTYAANRYITDSAAGGTAISTGEKTNNGMIAVRPDSTEIPTIMEIARKAGLSTGVVATSTVTHATPASFVAHDASRGSYEDIAKWFLKGTADVFIGGGINHFRARSDSADLTVELKKMGYDVVYSMNDLNNSKSGRIAGLLAEESMPYIDEGRDPYFLAAATDKAISVLSRNKKGFILMVEGSQIDWAAHDNNMKRTIDEVLDLDRAVRVAYDYAKKSGNTLIVVTADHETGGLSLTGGSIDGMNVSGTFGTKGHSAVMVPVFAFGPGASAFSGVQDNTDLFHDFIELLSLKK
ncbi:MAG: alkaline phosphatase [Bacteroidales bacterium]|nr:alkaline phosphatase [Bacteroidales bacterium]